MPVCHRLAAALLPLLALWAVPATATPVAPDSAVFVPLGSLGGEIAIPAAVADLGWVAGSVFTDGSFHGFVAQHGVVTDLGAPLGADADGYVGVSANAVNDQGDAAGSTSIDRHGNGGESAPVAWIGGTRIDLGASVGADHGAATDINSAAQVVGTTGNWIAGTDFIFRWSLSDGLLNLGAGDTPRLNDYGTVVARRDIGPPLGYRTSLRVGTVWTPLPLINGFGDWVPVEINNNDDVLAWDQRFGQWWLVLGGSQTVTRIDPSAPDMVPHTFQATSFTDDLDIVGRYTIAGTSPPQTAAALLTRDGLLVRLDSLGLAGTSLTPAFHGTGSMPAPLLSNDLHVVGAWYSSLATVGGGFDMAIDPRIEITYPVAGSVLQAGTLDSIVWNQWGAHGLRFELSTDPVHSPRPIDSFLAADGRHEIVVPETKSHHASFRLIHDHNPRGRGETGELTITGFYRTQLDALADWVPFDPIDDVWSFANTAPHIWPPSEYAGVNYASGVDPHTGSPYPTASGSPPDLTFGTKPQSTFPSWPLFVDTFGEAACYWSTSSPTYKAIAEARWAATAGAWGGSCFGLSTSALLQFSNPEALRAVFPRMPVTGQLRSLVTSADTRSVINEVQVGRATCGAASLTVLGGPTDVVRELRRAFALDEPDVGSLYMADQAGSGKAHAVIPVYVEQSLTQPAVWNIGVCDPNHPGVFDSVSVDTTASGGSGAWTFGGFSPAWSGTTGLDVFEAPSNYLTTVPPFYAPAQAGELVAATPVRALFAAAGRLQVYPSHGARVSIRDGSNFLLGYIDSTIVDSIPFADPIRPPDTPDGPPRGYDMPAGAYDIEMQGSAEAADAVTCFVDSLVWSYRRRPDATSPHRMRFDGGLVVTGDAAGDSVTVSMAATSATDEKFWFVAACALGLADSFAVRSETGDRARLVNDGAARAIDLVLRHASSTSAPVFRASALPLAAGAAMEIVPRWDSLGTALLLVLIDANNDGVPDDSLYVANGSAPPTSAGDLAGGAPAQPDVISVMGGGIAHGEVSLRVNATGIARVTVELLDIRGRRVAQLLDEAMPAGHHFVAVPLRDGHGRVIPSGVYALRYVLESVEGSRRTAGTSRVVVVR